MRRGIPGIGRIAAVLGLICLLKGQHFAHIMVLPVLCSGSSACILTAKGGRGRGTGGPGVHTDVQDKGCAAHTIF